MPPPTARRRERHADDSTRHLAGFHFYPRGRISFRRRRPLEPRGHRPSPLPHRLRAPPPADRRRRRRRRDELRRLREDAEIIVLDRGRHVSFADCGLPYYVGGEIENQADLLVQTPERLRAWLNLDVRTGHIVVGIDPEAQEVILRTADGVHRLGYDALVLAPGAQATHPPVDGLDSPRVATLRSVEDVARLREWVDAGARSAVVLGAGFIGAEAAEVLARRGITTTIVEFAEHVLPPLEREHAYPITQELRGLGVDVRTGTAAESITHCADADEVHLADGTRVRADLIVLATGCARTPTPSPLPGWSWSAGRSSSTSTATRTCRTCTPSATPPCPPIR